MVILEKLWVKLFLNAVKFEFDFSNIIAGHTCIRISQ